MESSIVLGIDIGGSHMTAAMVDLNSRTVNIDSRKRRLIDSTGSAEHILSSWADVINEVFKNHGTKPNKIGIAMPGPFNYEEGISLIQDQNKFNSLFKLNVKNLLAKMIRISPQCIKFINDASSFLQGEYFTGAAKDCNNVLGFTLGSGLGSAICKDGISEDADLWNAPFKDGIAEDYLSARWFLNRYQQLTGKVVTGVKELGEKIETENIVQQVFNEFGENFGLFLSELLSKQHFDLIVLGGNISNATSFFLPSLKRNLPVDIEITKSRLGEDAALIGAASYWNVVAVV